MMSNNEVLDPIERTEVMITTVDNPYDYFTQFKEWYMYDMEKGYNTCGYLDRVVELLGGIKDDMTQKEEDNLIAKAIDEIFQYNPCSDMYRRITNTHLY
ncbi:MAG: hypothetical protein J6B01_04785 [Ruminococcus sp.]|nr:hypothetical protein [Ruminococcus sp.]MBO5319108.1 hypothetical protein [Ruminococcus sp.]